ncbi:MAG: sigma-70 family RNA polymerase sigma factor [Bryobacteraceae bacterium]|nr:sigma-70 family RNA polymerase sigma factor [Bryobacteraceae bacterium]
MPSPDRLQEFESVALPLLPDLYRTATAMLRDQTEAKDLVQDVYLHAWKSFHRFQAGTNCRGWVFQILFHRLHHHRRKLLRFRLLTEQEQYHEEHLAAELPVPERLTDEEVLAALDVLSPEHREVVLLADVEQFTCREVSEMLSIPMGTVMSRLSRARTKLRSALAGPAAALGIGHGRRAR